jgi:anti-sigma regulatory factor (Ser/Thr protein kinase)
VQRVKAHALEQTYAAVADSVGAARRALTHFSTQAGASREQVEAVALAASEALTNVVKHAYPDRPGSIHVTAAVACGELCVEITDHGYGLRAHPSRGGLGLGLTVIASLCDELQIVTRPSGGTQLWLWFKLRSTAPADSDQPRGSVSCATSPARSRFSTTAHPAPDSTTDSAAGTS